MPATYTPTSLVLAAKSARSKFSPNQVKGAVDMLSDIHPDLDGKHLLFYANDERYARAGVDTCDCLQFRARREAVCPHRLAVMIHFKAVKIEREMKTVYPKVIEQMVGLMSDPFAIEHNAEIKFTVRANPNAGDGPFVLSMVAYSEDRDVERAIDRIGVYGSDLSEMCQEAFDTYQSIKEKYMPKPRQATHMGMVVDPAENRRNVMGAGGPVCPLCHGSGIVSDQVDYGSTVVSMPSACECVIDDNWDDLSREQKLLAWKDYLETVPRGDETYGRSPLDSSYGISHGITCANCGETFGAHYTHTCPTPNVGKFEIARVPVVDKEDLHETD